MEDIEFLPVASRVNRCEDNVRYSANEWENVRINMVDDYYTNLASDYEWLFQDSVVGSEGKFGSTSPGNEGLLEAALETLPSDAEILDCSCGIGADAIALTRRGFAVTASDGSASMVAEAGRRLKNFGIKLDPLQARWEDLPERIPGPFDLVLCLCNSIVHSGSRSRMVDNLRAIKRVLRPGGTLVVDSRNWDLLYRDRPRIVTASHAIHRHGIHCLSFYMWTIPDNLTTSCRAEIVLLFEDGKSAVSHHRHVIDFMPFQFVDLTKAIQEAGLTVIGDSYRIDGQFYAVAAANKP